MKTMLIILGLVVLMTVSVFGVVPNEVPEFTTIGAGLALLGAGVYIWNKRK